MKYSILFLFLFAAFAGFSQEMTNQKIEKLLLENTNSVEGSDGGWQAVIQKRPLLIVTDEAANRLRIFTFVANLDEISSEKMEVVLRANFTEALDAKYAIYNGLLVSVFTHPLKETTEAQFIDAIEQVNNLAENYGSSYSSTEVRFGVEWEDTPGKRVNVKPPYRHHVIKN